MTTATNPFHTGEIEAQQRAGAGDVAARVVGFIRPHMPDQHREFYGNLPFLVVSAADAQGHAWVTILEGREGFVTSPDPRALSVNARIDDQDPLAAAFRSGTDVGVLGIELATRRRNRLSGHLRPDAGGFALDVRQSFGNCPQYIREREWHWSDGNVPGASRTTKTLVKEHVSWIQSADTMFIGTGQHDPDDKVSNGYDASHRGGESGFVQVVDTSRLRIPDYAGNNFFNTIGNILKNPQVGLLFVDFETGGLLHITGRATIDWQAEDARDLAAHRMIDIAIERVIERPSAISLRWDADGHAVRQLAIVKKVEEAENTTSFYLAAIDGRPLAPFKAGQHLPIAVRLAPPYGKAQRSYSLSTVENGITYRLSIKREPKGLVSRLLHDVMQRGDVIEARAPSGDFVLPRDDRPVVLASAGIGLTPMMAMLQEIVRDGAKRPTWFVHGARNGRLHAFRDDVAALANAHENIAKQIFYSKPDPQDWIGLDYDHTGRVSAQALLDLNAGPDAQYMLCGPAAFVSEIQSDLEAAGVPPHHVHFETF